MTTLRRLEVQKGGRNGQSCVSALNRFLRTIHDLEQLVVSVERSSQMLNTDDIVGQADTLTLRSAHVSNEATPPREDVWDDDDIREIAYNCSYIRQLSCAFPQVTVLEVLDEDWDFWTVSIWPTSPRESC